MRVFISRRQEENACQDKAYKPRKMLRVTFMSISAVCQSNCLTQPHGKFHKFKAKYNLLFINFCKLHIYESSSPYETSWNHRTSFFNKYMKAHRLTFFRMPVFWRMWMPFTLQRAPLARTLLGRTSLARSSPARASSVWWPWRIWRLCRLWMNWDLQWRNRQRICTLWSRSCKLSMLFWYETITIFHPTKILKNYTIWWLSPIPRAKFINHHSA